MVIYGTYDWVGLGEALPRIEFDCPRNATSETFVEPTADGVKGFITCPAGDVLCSPDIHACPNMCFGKGTCYTGSDCLCDDGFGGRSCEFKCHESCRNCYADDLEDQCSYCYDNAELYLGNGPSPCVCSAGYTGDANNCEPTTTDDCDPSCATCNGTSEYDCLICFANAYVQQDGSCQCGYGYYDADGNGGGHNSTCSQCYIPECSASSNNVPTCTNPEVDIVSEQGNDHFTLECNNYPCHEMPGDNIYVTCPSSYSESMTFPNPTLCSDGQYYDGSQCADFSWSTVQPHFGDVGFLGRPTKASSHWSESNQPIEGVSYDPLPAECYDETAHQCGSDYTGDKRFSVLDIQRINDAGGDVTYSDGQSVNVAIDSYNAHVQPGGSTNPNQATYGVYHYHANPGWDNGNYANYVIGYAKDGVPFMGLNSTLASGSIAYSSYELRTNKTGEFHMDYEFFSGTGTLDEFNGGLAIIDGNSTYAYFATTEYPYLFRNFHGEYASSGIQGSVAGQVVSYSTAQNCQQCD